MSPPLSSFHVPVPHVVIRLAAERDPRGVAARLIPAAAAAPARLHYDDRRYGDGRGTTVC